MKSPVQIDKNGALDKLPLVTATEEYEKVIHVMTSVNQGWYQDFSNRRARFAKQMVSF